MSVTVLHVTRAFSAQPTLSECLPDADVVEAPLAEALAPGRRPPDVLWVSSASPAEVEALHARYPASAVLATPARTASAKDVVELIRLADLVLADEGIVLAAAGVQALRRRREARGGVRRASTTGGGTSSTGGGTSSTGPRTSTTQVPA
jgi:uncharacterized membrane protein YgcG